MGEDQTDRESSLRDEFTTLGENLKSMFNAAWESEERKKFKSEIEAGMRELGTAFTGLADEIRTSRAGETIRQEANEFHERVKSGEVEEKAREEIVKVLKSLNVEISKAVDKMSATEEAETEDTPQE